MMLKEQFDDPLSQFFQEGIQECIKYQKQGKESLKSRSQKLKDKIQKSIDLKKQKRKQRRILQKKKLHQILSPMTQQQKRQYLDSIKSLKQQKKQRVRQAMSYGQIIILDLTFESKMNNKQNKSLASQIQLIMKAIKYVKEPPNGIKGQLEKMRYQFWSLTVHQEDVSVFTQGMKERLIYLSPDAQETLDMVDPNHVFILGGLIDRTIIKNASLMRAKSLGIQCRKLPISQYMKGRACLNLDHVETGSWKEAFYFAAPKRWKKEEVEEEHQEEDEEENEKTMDKNTMEALKNKQEQQN